ncbi:hypothetical protein MFLO_02378 [Listeria floridensis FSL S10-1187]|uniref:XkdX family protein n=1 Tax=Listeria floridensis FSL S10-1187 TaxID=1265817 RepID=A0ABN0RHY6_9LIST|nr:XkdX family protein [Listeria floridensis]EUJ33512.1 hypothetical protein MFLO_02378 [Listeria floridensis FSL S10-1187]
MAIDWFEKIKEYYLGGFYDIKEVQRFVELKKITVSQSEEILNSKEEAE